VHKFGSRKQKQQGQKQQGQKQQRQQQAGTSRRIPQQEVLNMTCA